MSRDGSKLTQTQNVRRELATRIKEFGCPTVLDAYYVDWCWMEEVLTATYPGLARRDENLVITGNWRPVDRQLRPSWLRTPIRVTDEGCTEANN